MADSAIFHLDVKTIGRSQGRSSVAAAAYRAASKLHDERTGLVHDYRRKKNGIEDSYIAAPDNCGWITDRSTLWNTVEASEKRKNSTTAREWLVALPDALSDTQRADLTRALAIELVTRYKIAVDVAIHKPSRKGDQRNHHAHLLTTTREAGPEGMGAKTRILDAAKTGGVEIAEMRKWWAGMVNDALEAADSDARVDHRRKSVIVAEMKAEAEVLQQQANDIEALNVDVENPKDLVKALGKAARAIKDSGLSAATAKASDAPKLRERSKELELQAAQIAQTPLNSHDGPQLTAYKRRMAKTWKDQAKAKAALRAAEKAETARRETQERQRALEAQKAREEALRAAQQAEQYAEVTAPLVARARKNPAFADQVTSWGINLDCSNHEAARNKYWTYAGEGHGSMMIWKILTNEAEAMDEKEAQEAERQRLADVETFMARQIKHVDRFPTPAKRGPFTGFKALDPDSIDRAFTSKYRAKLTPEERTTTIQNMVERWVERIIEDIASLAQTAQSIWLRLTSNNIDAAKMLKQSLEDNPDLRKPLFDVLPKEEPDPEKPKQQNPKSKIDYNGPSGP